MTLQPDDQTRGDSTAFFSGDQSAQMSQNEVTALCLKAARGAGMSWGLAEEAGFAASWLTAHGIDGPRHLLSHLTSASRSPWSDLCPKVARGNWHAAKGKTLSPVVLGATLSDYANLPDGLISAAILTGPVDHPILLCPFLSMIAGAADGIVTLEWNGDRMDLDAHGATPPVSLARLEGQTAMTLRLSIRPGTAQPCPPTSSPAIAAATVAGLNAFARRTTVPASDASRAGAGAATSDND